MRQRTDPVPLTGESPERAGREHSALSPGRRSRGDRPPVPSRVRARGTYGIWLLPALVMALAAVVHGLGPIAVGIGLAAGLSLSGSV